MDTAKLFTNGSSQAIRLPKKYRFNGSEVYIKKLGNVIYLMPKEENELWNIFLSSLNEFSSDFMSGERTQDENQTREGF